MRTFFFPQSLTCKCYVLRCKSYITIPIGLVFSRKDGVKMSEQTQDSTIAFMMMRLFMFLETSCTYSECKSKLKRTGEKRRGEENCTVPAALPGSRPHQGMAETGLVPLQHPYVDMRCLGIQSARPSSGATRESMQASVLSYLAVSALNCKDEGNGLKTSLL